jgi:CheY-like chemotaxis protein
MAESKGLEFRIELDASLPRHMFTDSQRLEQVIRNLLSNAFKFTERGSVSFEMFVATTGWSVDRETLQTARSVIAFAVKDTGIGIPPEKQQIIFEAFQQADGSTSRKYGGTGLGLAISRELARLLGGEIRLHSVHGEGSTFTLYLPQSHVPRPTRKEHTRFAPSPVTIEAETSKEEVSEPVETGEPAEVTIEDDRGAIMPGDRVVLIVEDDLTYAKVLVDLAHEKGMKAVIAPRGGAALALARELKPDAITLDLHLPDFDGWRVLDHLKVDLATRHIPVHIISVDDDPQPAVTEGALGYLKKPPTHASLEHAFDELKSFIDRPVKDLLVVEDDPTQRENIQQLIGNGDVKTTAVASGQEALEAIRAKRYDCMVLDLGLPDMSGFELLQQIKKETGDKPLPIVIYTARELAEDEQRKLRALAESIVLKDARSPERLVDETALFLHRNAAKLPQKQRSMIESLYHGVLEGKKVLLVDDDVRNIFAMTSVLERFKMDVVSAENGRDALNLLQQDKEIDIVLMDIMLPTMDGYETIGAIRQIAEFEDLPIIAVTAKAMKGDREKCLAAGASDYIAKPVDADQLRSIMALWLRR